MVNNDYLALSEKQKAELGMLYFANSDFELCQHQDKAKKLLFRFNKTAPYHEKRKNRLLKKLLGQIGTNCWIESPFNCDYGYNIIIGDNFYSNVNLVILDGAKVTIGNNVYIAPNVGLYTAAHPLNPNLRNKGLETALPITIGNNVWIGGDTSVLQGVKIGNNVTIGAGSVVTHDIPDNCVAFGVPCEFVHSVSIN